MRSHPSTLAAAGTLAAALIACGEPTRPAPSPAAPVAPVAPVQSPVPAAEPSPAGTTLSVGAAGTAALVAPSQFTQTIEVRVFAGQQPAAGQPVDFVVTEGGGSISPARAWSNADGIATTTLTFPANVENTVVATAPLGLRSSTTVAAYTAWEGIVRRVGDHFGSGRAGAALPDPVVVEVRGRDGQPLAGRTLRFLPVDGGSASPATAVTDATGRARTVWTLRATTGLNRLKVVGDSLVPYLAHASGTR